MPTFIMNKRGDAPRIGLMDDYAVSSIFAIFLCSGIERKVEQCSRGMLKFFFFFCALQKLPLRNLLDVMHIEKNICESLLKLLFGYIDTAAS